MTLEEFNNKAYDFLEPFKMSIGREVDTFKRFKIYTGIIDNTMFCTVMAESFEGKDTRILRVSGSCTGELRTELVKIVYKQFKISFMDTMLFTLSVRDLIEKGDLYGLEQKDSESL